MNSQIVVVKQAIRSRPVLILVTCLIPVSLFLKSGFISVAVIWFLVFCLYNVRRDALEVPRTFALAMLLPPFFFVAYVIGISYASNVEDSLNLALRKFHLFAIPIGFLLLDHRKFQREIHEIVFWTFLVVCLISSVVCLGNAIVNMTQAESASFLAAGENHFYFASQALSSPLNLSPVYLSIYYNFALLIILCSDLVKSRGWKTALSIYFILLIVLCGSSAGLASLGLIVLVWQVQLRWTKTLVVALGLILGAVLVLTFLDSANLKRNLSNALKFSYTYEDGTLSEYTADRMIIWDAAGEAFQERWFLGYGTAEGQLALQKKYTEKGLTQELRDELNPHNQFISTALDLGLVGVLVLSAMLIVPFVISIRKSAFLAVGFLSLIIVFMFAESVLLRQKGLVFFSFFYSIILCFLFPSINRESDSK